MRVRGFLFGEDQCACFVDVLVEICGSPFKRRHIGNRISDDGHKKLFPTQLTVIVNGIADEFRRRLDGDHQNGVPLDEEGCVVRGYDIERDGEV
jgi:hypothetical protein